MLRHEDNTNSQEFIDPNDEDNSDGAAKLLGLINQIRKNGEDDSANPSKTAKNAMHVKAIHCLVDHVHGRRENDRKYDDTD